MTNLFPILYILTFVVVIILAVLGIVHRKNKDTKKYFTLASIGMVGRQVYLWMGRDSIPQSDEYKE